MGHLPERDLGDDRPHGCPPALADGAVVHGGVRNVVVGIEAVQAGAALRRGGAAVPAVLDLSGFGQLVRLALVTRVLGVASGEVLAHGRPSSSSSVSGAA